MVCNGDSGQRYRYNGKELDEATGLYDYGARYYDPAIARWGQVDPLADAYTSYSPYNYVLGNPIRLIDPDGMRVSVFDKMEAMGANHGSDWEPEYEADNKRIVVNQEGENDTMLSLWKWLGGKNNSFGLGFGDFATEYNNQLDENGNLKGGHFVLPDNIHTKTLNYATEHSGEFGNGVQNYDCRSHYCEAIVGNSLTNGPMLGVVGVGMTKEFTEVISKKDAIVGNTGIIFKLDQHRAIHFGYNNAGEEFVVTKNGTSSAPKLMKRSNLSAAYWPSWNATYRKLKPEYR